MQTTAVKRLTLAFAFALAFAFPAPAAGQRQAPNRQGVVQEVIDAHPEINPCDEDSADKGRALLVDWAAQRLNKGEEFRRWGRKSRGKPVDGRAVDPNTDGLTYLRADGRFEIYDVVSGTPPCNSTWDPFGPFTQGENGYWAPPQLRAETTTPTPGPIPGPEPTPAPTPQPGVEIGPLLLRVVQLLEEIDRKLDRIDAGQQAQTAALKAAIVELQAQVARGIKIRF